MPKTDAPAEDAPATDSEKDAEIARLQKENAALSRGEDAENERPIVQRGTDLVQEQPDGSTAVVGTYSPDE